MRDGGEIADGPRYDARSSLAMKHDKKNMCSDLLSWGIVCVGVNVFRRRDGWLRWLASDMDMTIHQISDSDVFSDGQFFIAQHGLRTGIAAANFVERVMTA